jgi:ATP-dependent Lon protease
MEDTPHTPKKRYNLRKRSKKKNIESSDSESSDDDSDYVPGCSDDEIGASEEEFNIRDWQRFVGKLFPSRATNRRLCALDKLDKHKEESPQKKRNRNTNDEEDAESEASTDEDTIAEDDIQEYIDEELFEELQNGNMKVNVIFTVAENPDVEYYGDSEYLDTEELDESESDEKPKEKPKNKKKKKKKKASDPKSKDSAGKEVSEDTLLTELKELMTARKKEGKEAMIKKLEMLVSEQTKVKEKAEKKANSKKKRENSKEFRKLLYAKNAMCDLKYFRDLSVKKQGLIIQQMQEIKKHSQLAKPYRMSLLESDISQEYKVTALNKINILTQMDRASGEYYKIKQWVDTFMRIPFGKYNGLPITMEDGPEKCSKFMDNAHKALEDAVYGLDDAKIQIMQMIGQWISNPKSVGTAIAIHGPMGTGKTTLVKEGISKVLNRPFAFLALGGATDSSFLEGHSYTYEGSVWGQIVDIIIKSKCMNPVIYFDELDKISDTPKGEEIIGILTHLTDTTQNSQFHDKYFSGIDFDLSKALFIFSYNDEKKVNPILRDRMYRIETKGYDKKEKTIIAKQYLMPVIEKNINFESGKIIITDNILHYIIDKYTAKEKGVRNLKRCLEIIYSKLNLFRLMKPDNNLFNNKMTTIKLEYPFNVTTPIVDKLIKREENGDIPFGLYM